LSVFYQKKSPLSLFLMIAILRSRCKSRSQFYGTAANLRPIVLSYKWGFLFKLLVSRYPLWQYIL